MRFWIKVIPLFLLLLGCQQQRVATNPLAYAPKTSYSEWQPLTKSISICAKYCKPLVPQDIKVGSELSLSELIDIALMNNPDTKETWADAKVAAANYGQSVSTYFPRLRFDGALSRFRTTQFSHTPDLGHHNSVFYQTAFTPELTVDYTLFDFGKRSSFAETAKQALFNADWSHNRQLQTTMQMVINDYYQYLYQKESLVADESDLVNARSTLDAATQKFKSGIVAIGDIAQAKTAYLQSKMKLIEQKNTVEKAFASLMKDVGLPANLDVQIENMQANIFSLEAFQDLSQLLDMAQNQRADYKAAVSEVKSQQANVSYAKSVSLPILKGEFDLGKNFYNNNDTESYHFTAALKLSFPLFRGYYFRNGVKEAVAQVDKSKALLENTELGLIKDVTTAKHSVITAKDTLQCSKEYLQAAQEQYDIAIANYKAGTNTILDVLSAQSSLADARAQNAHAQNTWYTSLSDLAYATGSLCLPNQLKDDKLYVR